MLCDMDANNLNADLPLEAEGMGRTIAEYRIANIWSWVFGSVFGVIGLLACAITLLDVLVPTESQDGTLALGVCSGLLTLVMLGLAGWQFASAVQKRARRVIVLESGLVRIDPRENKAIRWDDVTTVYQKIDDHYRALRRISTTHVFVLYLKDNTKITFNDSVRNIMGLGDIIQEQVTSRLLPGYWDAYNSGGTLAFGKFSLSKAGISNGWETIPWDEVEQARFEYRYFRVRKRGKWLDWAGQSASNTPNMRIFIDMIDTIAGINTKK